MAALHDAHVQIKPVLEDKLDSLDALRPYAAVCLPQMACMSDREVEVLRRNVSEGGGLGHSGRRRPSSSAPLSNQSARLPILNVASRRLLPGSRLVRRTVLARWERTGLTLESRNE